MSDAVVRQLTIDTATARMAAALACAPAPGTQGYVLYEESFYSEFVST